MKAEGEVESKREKPGIDKREDVKGLSSAGQGLRRGRRVTEEVVVGCRGKQARRGKQGDGTEKMGEKTTCPLQSTEPRELQSSGGRKKFLLDHRECQLADCSSPNQQQYPSSVRTTPGCTAAAETGESAPSLLCSSLVKRMLASFDCP